LTKSEILKGLRAASESTAYDNEALSTPEGRESHRLRLEGRRLHEAGDARGALHLFHQALSYHPDTDDSAAASAARHDLAHLLSEEGRSTPWGLETAEKLFRQALKSPSRARVKFRRAQTMSALGVCLRQRIREHGEEPALLLEIERLYRDAIADLVDCGAVGFQMLAMVHQNLANFLSEHRGAVDQALFQYKQAFTHARKHEQWRAQRGPVVDIDPTLRRILYQSRLKAADLLSERRKRDDLAQAERLVKEVLQDGDPHAEDLAKLTLALVLLAGNEPDRTIRAQQLLAQVRLERLNNRKQWIGLAHALLQADAPDAALLRLRQYIQQGITERARNTIADFMADSSAFSFQSAAALAARIYVQDKQDALSAFLILENTSGMRFGEMISEYAWRPETPLSQALSAERQRQMGLTHALDTIARNIDRMEPELQRQTLTELVTAHPDQRLPPSERPLHEALRRASQEQVPVRHLDALIREGVQRVERAYVALKQVDAGFARARGLLGTELVPRGLMDLLHEHHGSVLLRVDLQEDLLAVAVWLEAGELRGRHACIPFPSQLLSLVVQAAEGLKGFSLDDHRRLSALLTELDLSAALPPGNLDRVVLLPSNLAAQLPLIALGPPGSRLIDRAGSIIWLPCLYPMRIRPAPVAPRAGDVVALPVPGLRRLSEVAFPPPSAAERRLHEAEASAESLRNATRSARTLCLLTHGKHAPGEAPLLQVASGDFQPLQFTHELLGIERIEIWACQSGAHRPSNPLTPPANEGFGLDFQLLIENGARTAIGTLWSVPQLATGALMRSYRQQVLAGEDPARALANAQRWWLRKGASLLIGLLRQEHTLPDALFRFARELDAQHAPGSIHFPKTQGLMPTEQRETSPSLEEAALSSAVAWAGIRFVGIPNFGPDKPWTPVEDRPLTHEEQAELTRLLSTEPPSTSPYLHEHQEPALERARALAPSEFPSPAQALDVARRLRDRLTSSHLDNLLAALAWLHEALAAPELAAKERTRLSTEAAHLWLDLSWGELPMPVLPEPVALARAGRLLLSLAPGESVDIEAARIRHLLLQRIQAAKSPPERVHALQDAVDQLAQALHSAPLESTQGLRAVTVALDLLALCPPEFQATHTRLLELAQLLAKSGPPSPEQTESWHRMLGALAHHSQDEALPDRSLRYFTPRELLRAALPVSRQLLPTPGHVPFAEFMNEALSRLESNLWGYTNDDGTPLMRTTETLGEAYRELLRHYLASHAQLHPEEARAKLACLQYACDLRLTLLHRLARAMESVSPEDDLVIAPLWRLLCTRRMLLTSLWDAALMPALPPRDENTREPHPLDPFTLPARLLRERCADFTGYSAWGLDQCCASMRERAPTSARTAAFEALRVSQQLEDTAVAIWKNFLEAERQVPAEVLKQGSLSELLTDGRELEQLAQMLHALPEGEAVLGLVLLNHSTPLLMACWNDGTGQYQKVFRLDSNQAASGLAMLLASYADDATSRRGASEYRRAPWATLEAALAPALEALLHTAQKRRRLRWRVLTPGVLRPLPWLGLRVNGAPLAAQVEELTHLPSFRFSSSGAQEPSPDFTACLLARARGEAGATSFGEAVVETLRRLQPPHLVLDCRSRRGTELPELHSLDAQSSRVRTLRLYGTGSCMSLTPSTAHLSLEGGQGMRAWNLRDTWLPRCDVVELWASTASHYPMEAFFRDGTDRIPGLAGSFLANGAAAVIDVAWPVHDVVKALVCEQYGLLRHQHGHGPAQLARAIAGTSALLSQLERSGPYGTVRDVLERIDERRQVFALQTFQVDPRRLIPFADLASHPTVRGSAAEFVEELCQPVHLGAFRWWGT
jgi:hypothetical protein